MKIVRESDIRYRTEADGIRHIFKGPKYVERCKVTIKELEKLAEKAADDNNYCDFSGYVSKIEEIQEWAKDEMENWRIWNPRCSHKYGNPNDSVPNGSPCNW